MPDTDISDAMRAIALKRWADKSPEERRRGTAAATAANRARPRPRAAELVAALEARFSAEVASLRSRVAELEQRVAA